MEDNFLAQLVRKPARKGIPLDVFFINSDKLFGDVTVGGHLGHSDHKMTRVLNYQRSKDRDISRTSLTFGG